MNWADYAILSILGLSTLISFIRGFVREALSLVSWAIAAWVAFKFYPSVADAFQGHIAHTTLRTVVAIALLFVGTLIVMAIVNYFIGYLIEKTGLGGTDRMIGIIFGLGRGALVISIITLVLRVTPVVQEPWWQESILITKFKPIDTWLEGIIVKQMPEYLNWKKNQLLKINNAVTSVSPEPNKLNTEDVVQSTPAE